MTLVLQVVVTLLLGACLVLLPLGIPGLWIMVVLLGGAALAGWISLGTWVWLALAAGVTELVEFGIVKWMGDRYGGSRRAFWGAILGGFVGVLVGLPVPVVGSVLAGLLGTFAGAAAATLHETRSLRHASRVGWGVTLARIAAVGLKVGVGVAVVVVAAASFFLT
jgi:hypothetical protein